MPKPDDLLTDTTSLRLLISEDDPKNATRLTDFFSNRDHEVVHVADGPAALQEMRSLPPYDVALLGAQLPQKNGFAVLREARTEGVNIPTILLATSSKSKHTIRAFQLGADDYVTKPVDVWILAARVQAVHRRAENTRAEVGETYSFGDTTVDFVEQTVTRNETDVTLTDLELDLLRYLINHRGRTVTRKQLLRDVWEISGDITTRTIDRHVSALRKKIEPTPDDPIHLQTVYGIGYKFVD